MGSNSRFSGRCPEAPPSEPGRSTSRPKSPAGALKAFDRIKEVCMLAIWVKVRIKPGERQRFLKAIEVDALGSERDEPGCLRFNVLKDATFRARFRADALTALAAAELTEEERQAFARWDARRLNELGGSLHLLISIPGLGAH